MSVSSGGDNVLQSRRLSVADSSPMAIDDKVGWNMSMVPSKSHCDPRSLLHLAAIISVAR